MASRQYFAFTGRDKKGKPQTGNAVIVGGKELTVEEAVAYIQKTNYPKGNIVVETARIIGEGEQDQVIGDAPDKVKNIFQIMDEAENGARRRAEAEAAAKGGAA